MNFDTLSFVFYVSESFSGAFGFGKYTQANILDAFSGCGYVFMDIISIIYAIVLALSCPLLVQPARLIILVWSKKTADKNFGFFVMVGFVTMVFTTLLACLLENIAAIFGLFTAIAGYF